MILYLAAGGGLGHLTRMRAMLHTLAIDEPVTLLAPPRHGGDRRIIGDMVYIPLNDDLASDLPRYRRWLLETIDRVAPTKMIVDTFPGGILGELCELRFPEGLQLDLVARAIRWERYTPILRGEIPCYATAYITEPLPDDQLHHLRRRCDRMLDIEPVDPPSTLDVEGLLRSLGLKSGEFRLVVHSGSAKEIMELIAHASLHATGEALSPPILLIAPRRPAALDPRIPQLDLYPATPLFAHAAWIFTGCGFNAMRQTRPWRDRHIAIPFERRYDDQAARKNREYAPDPLLYSHPDRIPPLEYKRGSRIGGVSTSGGAG